MSMFFSGFAGALGKNMQADREENNRLTEERQQRENAILMHLTTADDPEIASRAVAGLMDQAAGRTKMKGLRGFLGETESNPALPTIRALMSQTRGVQGPEPENATMHGPTAPPPSAAMPGGSAVTGNAPLSVGQIEGAGGQPGVGQHPLAPAEVGMSGPGHVQQVPAHRAFLTPQEKVRATEESSLMGRVSALRQARNPMEQRVIGGAAFAPKEVPGTVRTADLLKDDPSALDVNGHAVSDQPGMTWRAIQQPDLTYRYRAVAPPTALQNKPTKRMMADPKTGEPHLYQFDSNNQQTDLGALPVKEGRVTFVDENNQEVTVPVPTVYQKPSAVAPPPVAAAAGSSAPAAMVAPPGVAAPAAQAPAAGAAVTPPPTAASPAAAAGPRGGRVLGTTKQPTQQVEGAYLGPEGEPRVVTANFDPVKRIYYDPTTNQPFQGFIPGKEGAEVVRGIANAQTTKTTIDRAIATIQALGLADDTDPNTTARLVDEYRSGKGGDPGVAAFAAMNDFAKIQGASQYVQGTRAFKYIQQIQQHLPTLPSTKEAGANQLLGGHIVSPDNPLARAVAGTTWDSPKQMVEKLLLARTNLDNIVKELQSATGKVPERAIGGVVTAPPGGASQPVSQPAKQGTIRARDAAGKLHEAPAGTPLPAGWKPE